MSLFIEAVSIFTFVRERFAGWLAFFFDVLSIRCFVGCLLCRLAVLSIGCFAGWLLGRLIVLSVGFFCRLVLNLSLIDKKKWR